jgi:hypothetical protein
MACNTTKKGHASYRHIGKIAVKDRTCCVRSRSALGTLNRGDRAGRETSCYTVDHCESKRLMRGEERVKEKRRSGPNLNLNVHLKLYSNCSRTLRSIAACHKERIATVRRSQYVLRDKRQRLAVQLSKLQSGMDLHCGRCASSPRSLRDCSTSVREMDSFSHC